MTVVAFVPDLMDQSKLRANARTVKFVSEHDLALADEGDTVVVDLSRIKDMESIANLRAHRVVGFGSHVDKGLMQDAQEAGVTQVMPRSIFFARLNDVLP